MKTSWESLIYQRALLELGDLLPDRQQLDNSALERWVGGMNVRSFEGETIWSNDGPLGRGACQKLTINDLMKEIGVFVKTSYWFDVNPLPALRTRFPNFGWKSQNWYESHCPSDIGNDRIDDDPGFQRIWHLGNYTLMATFLGKHTIEKIIFDLED